MVVEDRLKIITLLTNSNVSIAIQYIEYLIYELLDDNTSIHDHLLGLYYIIYETDRNVSASDKISKFLDTSTLYDANLALSKLPNGT